MEISTSVLYGWGMALAGCPDLQFSEATGQSPSPKLPLCLPTAIEPQKEEADENCNSVNTRMRKTQVGLLFPELGHFSKYFIDYLLTKVRRGKLGDHLNGETEAQKEKGFTQDQESRSPGSQSIIIPHLLLHLVRCC